MAGMIFPRTEPLVRWIREFFQDQWFDRTRAVRTSGNVPLALAGVRAEAVRDSEIYQPARPAHIRQAIRDVPARDLSNYTFVDLGSGKGRTLFIAAEFPFRQIIGVEFSPVLHERATSNIRSFRRARGSSRGTSTAIVSMHGDARDFIFPDGPFVLYMFNPFGAATMQVVLDNMATSLARHPRHAVIVLLWPRCEDQVARIHGMRLVHRTPEYQIFEVFGGRNDGIGLSRRTQE